MRPRPGKVRRMRTTSRRKALTEADRAEWAAYAQKVRPLPGVAAPPAPPPLQLVAVTAVTAAPPSSPKPSRAAGPAALNVGENPGGLDAASWNRLRGGKLAPTRTLDLHGRTAQRAFSALHAFIEAAHADRVRVVEVITGRGPGDSGVLRRELPMWLNLPALRPLVLAASHPHAANVGSVRLLLRRPRG